MKGFPKFINTKQDVLNLLKTHPEKTKKFLQNALDGYEGWVAVSTDKELIEDSTHKIIEQTDEKGEVSYIQQVYQVVPGNTLDRIGITAAEAGLAKVVLHFN